MKGLGRRLPGSLGTALRAGSTALVVCAVAALVLLAFGGNDARADMFEVRNVKVDVTADNAAAARQKALLEGQRKAFDKLLDRLSAGADRSALGKLSMAEIEALVEDLSVKHEKASAVRYIAALDVRFNEAGVRQLLANAGIPFAGREAKPLVVLPVYRSAGALVLWDEPNPWRVAWEAEQSAGGLVPVIVPDGDLGDIATIGAAQAVGGDVPRLLAIARRYGAREVLVANAEAQPQTAQGPPTVTVSVARFGPAGKTFEVRRTFAAAAGEQLQALLARAAAAIRAEVEARFKQTTIVTAQQGAVIPVVVPIAALRDWVQVRRRLGQVALVSKFEIVSLTREETRLNLYYLGNLEQLSEALRDNLLTLLREGDVWTLRPAASAAGGER